MALMRQFKNYLGDSELPWCTDHLGSVGCRPERKDADVGIVSRGCCLCSGFVRWSHGTPVGRVWGGTHTAHRNTTQWLIRCVPRHVRSAGTATTTTMDYYAEERRTTPVASRFVWREGREIEGEKQKVWWRRHSRAQGGLAVRSGCEWYVDGGWYTTTPLLLF